MTTPVPEKDNELLYAAGDVIVWVGPPNTGAPVDFEDMQTVDGYVCAGWVDTSGYIFKLDETIKDIPAAGTLTPIRSILTGGSKSVQATLLEGLNPVARALYDDVPIFPLTTSPLKPGTTPVNVAKYIIPDPPDDNRYSVVWDSIDGDKAMRLYAPFAKVTARGNDQVQQADVTSLDITWTMYPGIISDGVTTVPGVAKRYINYGKSVTSYFVATSGGSLLSANGESMRDARTPQDARTGEPADHVRTGEVESAKRDKDKS